MSIINQTLKELDKRRGQEPRQRVRSRYVAPRSGRSTLWLAPLMLLCGAGLSWWWLTTVNAAPLEPPASESVMPAISEQTPTPVVLVESTLVESALEERVLEESTEQTVEEESPVEILAVAASETAVAGSNESIPEQTSGQVVSVEPQTPARPVESSMQIERVERSATELAELRYQQGIAAMEQGNARQAEQLLQEALLLQAGHINARARLAAHLYGRGFTQRALDLLTEGLALQPGNTRLVLLKARIYEERGDLHAALNILIGLPAVSSEQGDIRVLRAALANEVGDYHQAADDYRALLALNTEQALWWLGLAVAEEGRGDRQAAYDAYQQALTNRGLDASSRDFANQRQEALR